MILLIESSEGVKIGGYTVAMWKERSLYDDNDYGYRDSEARLFSITSSTKYKSESVHKDSVLL